MKKVTKEVNNKLVEFYDNLYTLNNNMYFELDEYLPKNIGNLITMALEELDDFLRKIDEEKNEKIK